MNRAECQKLIDAYVGWLRQGLSVEDVGEACELTTPFLDSVLNGLGVRAEGGQLLVEASAANLGQRLHSLVQAMLAVNDMFVMAQHRVASFFFEDVRNFLDSNDIRYTPRVKLAGKSGYDHGIDFLIPKSRKRPERILQAIAAPKKDNIVAYLWTLSDTRAARAGESEAEAYAFLNDQEQTVGGDVVEALNAYRVVPAIWSQRGNYVDALTG